MKSTEIYSPNVESFEVIFVEEANSSREEGIANKSALHGTLPTRNLPNILRNSNIKAHRNFKIPASDKTDTYLLLNAKRTCTSLELNATLSRVDSEKRINYNKISSPKLHHQRKQVHNPLNLQCDTLDWSNDKNKELQKADQVVVVVGTSCVLQSQKGNVSTKKSKRSNKCKRHSYGKKRKKVKACKTGNKTGVSNEKSGLDFGLINIPDINDMNDKAIVLQSVDHFFNNDTFCESNVSSCINGSCTNKNDIGAESEESFNIPYCNNNCNRNVCDFEETYDIKYNPVISGNSTELNSQIISQNRFTNNGSSAMDDVEGSADENNASSYFKSKVLYNCTCMNCTSLDKDVMFYEDPVSMSMSGNNNEAELYSSLCDLYSDCYHAYGNNWLIDFNNSYFEELEESSYCEEIEETNITEENADTGCDTTKKVIENNANVSSVGQSKLKDAQVRHIDEAQDADFETYSTEFIAQRSDRSSERSSKLIRNVKDLNEDRNFENVSMEESTINFQNGTFAPQNAVSADVSVSKSNCKEQEEKQDLYVIQCAQCEKLFNENHRFRKHFTRCDFYKEDFNCHICGKMYRYKSSLVQHLRKIHEVSDDPHEKDFYICNKCSKSYVRYRAFQRHMLLHDD